MAVLFSLSIINTTTMNTVYKLCAHKLSFLLVMYIVNSGSYAQAFQGTANCFLKWLHFLASILWILISPHPGQHFESSLPIGSEVAFMVLICIFLMTMMLNIFSCAFGHLFRNFPYILIQLFVLIIQFLILIQVCYQISHLQIFIPFFDSIFTL